MSAAARSHSSATVDRETSGQTMPLPEAGGLRFGPGAERLADDYDVLTAYQVFLERDPETWSDIQERVNRPIQAIAQEFMRSGEFGGLTAQPCADGARLIHARSGAALSAEQVSWVADLLSLAEEQRASLKSRVKPRRAFVLVHLDTPVPGDCLPAGGRLAGSGWVIAKSAVEQISVYLDDRLLDRAAMRPAPRELAQRFPHYAAARATGFQFSTEIPERAPTAARPMLVLLLRTADGATTRKLVPLSAPSQTGCPAPAPPSGAFRGAAAPARARNAETERRLAALGKLGLNPFFLVLVRAESASADGAEAVRATLRSLHGQAYANWRAVVVLPEHASPASAATAIGSGAPHLLGRTRLRAGTGLATASALPWPEVRDPRFLIGLGAGDRLAADALLELAAASGGDPAPDLIVAENPSTEPAPQPIRTRGRSAADRAPLWCATPALVDATGITPAELIGSGAAAAARRLAQAQVAPARVRRNLREPEPAAGGSRPPAPVRIGRAPRRWREPSLSRA